MVQKGNIQDKIIAIISHMQLYNSMSCDVLKAYKNIGKKSSAELDIDSIQFSSDRGIHPAQVMGVSLMRSIVVLDNLQSEKQQDI